MPKVHTDQGLAKQAEQVGTAQRELDALRVEQERLPEQIRQAAAEANAEQLVKLRRRSEELPMLVWAAEVKLVREAITAAELAHAKFDAEAKAAEPAIEPAKQHLDEAQARFNEAVGRHRDAMYRRDESRLRAAEQKRQLERLMAEQTGPVAPVVRSLPHASQGAA